MTEPTAKTLGQLAYEGYMRSYLAAYPDEHIIQWTYLSATSKEAWQVAADCAVSGQHEFESEA